MIVLSALAFASWMVCRIFLFSYCCIYSLFYSLIYVLAPKVDEVYMNTVFYPIGFMGVMLSALEVMHIFWTYYIIETGLGMFILKKADKQIDS